MKHPAAPRQPTAIPAPSSVFEKMIPWALHGVALAMSALVTFALVTGTSIPGPARWPVAILVSVTALSTLVATAKQLPQQNVWLAAAIIAFIGSLAHGLAAMISIPFGPISFTGAGGRLFNVLPWSVPLLWIILVLNSRGVVRLILRPWRKLRTYGFWLIGLTAVLTALFDFALEPFATQVNHFWLWHETKLPFTWYGMPVINPLGWLMTTLLILAFATPALINKQPRSRQSPPDYYPLVVWVLGMMLCGIGAATQHLWPAVAVCAVNASLVSMFAIRGARW